MLILKLNRISFLNLVFYPLELLSASLSLYLYLAICLSLSLCFSVEARNFSLAFNTLPLLSSFRHLNFMAAPR